MNFDQVLKRESKNGLVLFSKGLISRREYGLFLAGRATVRNGVLHTLEWTKRNGWFDVERPLGK